MAKRGPKPSEERVKRRRAIVELIKQSGFSSLPTQEELAQRFGVTQKTISHDLKKIREEIPPESLIYVDVRLRKFYREVIGRLKKRLNRPNIGVHTERELIMSINQLLKDEILIRQKLGLIEEPSQKVDATLKIKWES